jgi:hypothetical protein
MLVKIADQIEDIALMARSHARRKRRGDGRLCRRLGRAPTRSQFGWIREGASSAKNKVRSGVNVCS